MPPTAALAFAAQDHLLALLRDGLGTLPPPGQIGVVVPQGTGDLPAVVVSLEDTQLQPSGLGGVVGLQRGLVNGAPADLGSIESARLAASFTVQVWAADAAGVDDIIRRLAALSLEGARRQHDDPAAGRRTTEVFLRLALRRLGATGRPAAGAVADPAAASMVVRELSFGALYERTAEPLAQEAPPIQQIPATYHLDAAGAGATEQETITGR